MPFQYQEKHHSTEVRTTFGDLTTFEIETNFGDRGLRRETRGRSVPRVLVGEEIHLQPEGGPTTGEWWEAVRHPNHRSHQSTSPYNSKLSQLELVVVTKEQTRWVHGLYRSRPPLSAGCATTQRSNVKVPFSAVSMNLSSIVRFWDENRASARN